MQSTKSKMWVLMTLIVTIPHIYGQVKFDPVCQIYQSKLVGSCVPITECPFLNNYLNAARLGQTFALDILRGSVCTSNRGNGNLNVCCPPQGGFPEQCGGKNGTERIVGGENAPLTAWPWMAIIRAKGGDFGGAWVCGGVLISARYVLTAAHCVVNVNYNLAFVRLGELVLNENPDSNDDNLTAPSPQDKDIEKIIGHPKYGSGCNKCNDIALLRLASPARIDNLFVKPICISTNPGRDGVSPSHINNFKAWAAGWGSSVANPYVFTQPAHLQQLQLPVQDLPFCQDRKREYPDPNMIFCAGDGIRGTDTCRGDSGGPLMVASQDNIWYTIGIVSLGSSICGAEGSQTVFTNISYYRTWIEENLL